MHVDNYQELSINALQVHNLINYYLFITGKNNDISNQLFTLVDLRVNINVLRLIIVDEGGYSKTNTRDDNIEIYLNMHPDDRRQKLINHPNLFNVLLRDLVYLGLAKTGTDALEMSINHNFTVFSVIELLNNQKN
jgi:hypothetical protein